jgi:hypothetical protein
MNRLLGIVLMILAIGIAVIPQFNNCSYDGRSLILDNGKMVPMKCLWTARAELATGASLLVVGVMVTVSRAKESRRNLSVMGAVLGIVAILLPTYLIGVCQSKMDCNIVMRPAMAALGSLSIAGSLISLVVSRGREKKS